MQDHEARMGEISSKLILSQQNRQFQHRQQDSSSLDTIPSHFHPPPTLTVYSL